jgi:hypothetical protein
MNGTVAIGPKQTTISPNIANFRSSDSTRSFSAYMEYCKYVLFRALPATFPDVDFYKRKAPLVHIILNHKAVLLDYLLPHVFTLQIRHPPQDVRHHP